MYDKEVILKKLFDLKTDIYCFVNDKCFNAKEEDKILNELNKERSNSLFWKSVVSISELVLANGGKLYFKLKDDKGIFVIEKNWNKHLSQVGRYSPEEGEVLLDEEIDEDIYRNIQKFIPKFTSISEINEELKDKKINLRKTIEKIISKDIGKSKEYLVEIEDYGNDLENKFDFELYSDEYYEKLEELKDEGKWIYITAVYATSEIASFDDVYECELEDDYFETAGVESCLGNCDLRVNFESFVGEMDGDFGIMIQNDKIDFQYCCGGMFRSIDPIDNLSEPLNAFAIELMMNIIEFEE